MELEAVLSRPSRPSTRVEVQGHLFPCELLDRYATKARSRLHARTLMDQASGGPRSPNSPPDVPACSRPGQDLRAGRVRACRSVPSSLVAAHRVWFETSVTASMPLRLRARRPVAARWFTNERVLWP